MGNRPGSCLIRALLGTVHWVLLHLVRDPLAWLGVALVAAGWPLLASFAPIGLTTTDRSLAAPIYELVFWSAVLGVSIGLALLIRGRWFLAPLSTPRRLAVEATGLLSAVIPFLALALATTAVLGAPPTGDLMLGAALSCLHLVAIGLLLLRTPLAPAAASLSLPVLVWALPALLAGAGGPGPALAHVLAAGQHLALSPTGNPAPPQSGVTVLPIIGMVLAAGLLHRPDAIRRPG